MQKVAGTITRTFDPPVGNPRFSTATFPQNMDPQTNAYFQMSYYYGGDFTYYGTIALMIPAYKPAGPYPSWDWRLIAPSVMIPCISPGIFEDEERHV